MSIDNRTHAPATTDQRRILVAEDNVLNQKLIVRQLALLGFDADVAGDGRQALECWQRGHYELLLCDLHMPHMDGFELAAAIRAAEQTGSGSAAPAITLIALTASAPHEESERCRAAGMDGCLGKPLQLGELKVLLQAWLPTEVGLPAIAVASAANPHATVDVRVLEALIGPDPVTNRKLQRHFQASAAAVGAKLRQHCQGGESLQASDQAHKLCSAARAVGALGLGALCSEMEISGKSGDAEDLMRLWPLFERELEAVNRFLDALDPAPHDHSRDEVLAHDVGVTP